MECLAVVKHAGSSLFILFCKLFLKVSSLLTILTVRIEVLHLHEKKSILKVDFCKKSKRYIFICTS